MTRLRYLAEINPPKSRVAHLPDDTEVVFAPMEALADGLGGLDITTLRPLAEVNGGSYSYFEEGDLLLAKVTPCFENGKKAIAIDLPRPVGFATSEVHVIRPDPNRVDRRYLNYVFCSEPFIHAGIASMTGAGGLRRVSEDAVLNYRLPISDPVTQQRIADFLDRETALINELIQTKGQLMQLLEQRRDALITSAVTRGLDPSAPLKPSNLYGLGDVPQHWKTVKVTHGFAQLGSGATPKSDDQLYYNGKIPWVTTSELRETLIQDTNSKITEAALRDYPALRVYPAGTLLFALYGATIGRMGILGIPAATNQACMAFAQPTALDTKFTFYWLWMRRPTLIALAQGGGQPNLSQADLRNVRIPAPDLDEQRKIVTYLDHETGKIREVSARIEQSVSLLQELRSALITAAVTGQIDVDTWRKRGNTERKLEAMEQEVQA